MLRFMNPSADGFANTGCDYLTTPQSKHQDEAEELELEDHNDKNKGIDAIDYSDSGLPLTFCTKRKIVLDIPPYVVQVLADIMTPRKTSREGYRGNHSSSISGVFTW